MSTAAPPMIDLLPGTAESISQASKAFNGGREIAEIPEAITELSRKTQVAVMSVGPWPQVIPCGSLGMKYVPACREGEEYSDPLVLEGLTIEMYPLREGRMDPLMHKEATGWNDGHQIIGVGKHLSPANSKVKLGLFVTKGNPDFPPLSAKDANDPEKRRWWLRERFKPTKEEIDKAKKALNTHYNYLVNQARSAAAQGQKTAEETIRPKQHILAAQKLGLDPQTERWMQNAVAEKERTKCLYCGVSIPDNVVKCPNCREIIDQEKYDKLKAKGKKNKEE